VWQIDGGHGGGDPLLLKDIFAPDSSDDKYLQAADYRAWSWSILTGITANHAMADGAPIHIKNLISGLAEPDYPPMPSPTEPIQLGHIEKSVPELIKL
jgi:hypothetical protein